MLNLKKRTAADVPTTRVVGMIPSPAYGMELVMDLHDCDHTKFTREGLTQFFKELCDHIGMEREALHFWDYEGYPMHKDKAPPHLKGTSAVQFIKTSSIVIHSLDDLHRIYINIFSCKEFSAADAVGFATEFFGAGWCGHHSFERS
jgi:S-adenosylmethionine/arginine decarboxylase-like enzyme